MKSIKLFLMTITMALTLDAVAVKSDLSWRKDLNSSQNYDEKGYKGSGDFIFVGFLDEHGNAQPLTVKLVRTSYADLMNEIRTTIKYSTVVQSYVQKENIDINKLKLWDRDMEHMQTAVTNIAPKSRWIIVDNLDQNTKRRIKP